MFRSLLCLTTLLLLSACAAPMLPLQVTNLNDSASLRVTDLRPKQEQLQEHFSLMVFNEAYGKSRIAVSDVQPPALRLLQHRAFESLPVAMRSGELKVRHLVVYRNMEAAGKSIAAGAVGGVVGAVLLEANATRAQDGSISSTDRTAFDAAGTQEWKRAMYSIAENPTHLPCYIVFIETELDGRRAFTRTLMAGKLDTLNALLPTALDAAIRYNVEQLARP